MRLTLFTLAALALTGCPGNINSDMMPPAEDMPAPTPDVITLPDIAPDLPAEMDATPDVPEPVLEDASPDLPPEEDMPEMDMAPDMPEEMDTPPDMPAMPEGRPMVVGVGNWGLRASTTDGVTWTEIGSPPGGNDHTPDLLRGVGFGNGTFLAVGGNQNSMIMRSTDGVTWQEDMHPGGRQWLGGVAWDDGVWVAAGGVGTNMRSTDDGVTWTQHPNNFSRAARAMAAGDGVFVAVGDQGLIAVSRDAGLTWTEHIQPGSGFGSVTYGAGHFVAVGARWMNPGFETHCVISADATNWTPCPLTSERFAAASFADGHLIIGMAEGIAVSSNGVDWTTHMGSYPSRVAGHGMSWTGERNGARWSSTMLESGWTSMRYERGFRAMIGGWVR